MQKLYVFRFYEGKNIFALENGGGLVSPPAPPFFYCPGLLFLLPSSDTETAKYFHTFDVGLACIYIVVLQGIPLKLSLLWCFHIWSKTIFDNTDIALLFSHIYHILGICLSWHFVFCLSFVQDLRNLQLLVISWFIYFFIYDSDS